MFMCHEFKWKAEYVLGMYADEFHVTLEWLVSTHTPPEDDGKGDTNSLRNRVAETNKRIRAMKKEKEEVVVVESTHVE